MSITSLLFLSLFIVSLGIYFATPAKFQWYVLLAFSVFFFCVSSTLYTGIYLIISIVATTLCAREIKKRKNNSEEKKAQIALAVGIVINVGILAALKYTNFFIENINRLTGLSDKLPHISQVNWLAPIGISFYTMQIVGYLLDIYWGITDPQTSVLKTALFVGYYPQMTSGPIARHNEVKDQLYAEHRFEWNNVTFGLQRMLWGIFKKIVLSSRLGILVDTIYADTIRYDGMYIWFAAFAYTMQLYTDFSGCMDIIIGASECYGIVLPENFKTPFFSRSVQEFWQRWHMTLGSWLKDYILYPILKTKTWYNITKWVKEHLGKKAAKQLPPSMGMLCVWLLIGLWHGGKWKFIIGVGLWFWGCIVFSQILEPLFKKIIVVFKINTETFSWHLFQSLRVFWLVSIGIMFFRLESFKTTINTIKLAFTHWNPEIFYNKELFNLALNEQNFRLVVVGLLCVLIVSVMQWRIGSVREWIAKQNIVFRWLILFTLIFSIIIYGQYGPGYDAQSFIYQGF